MADTPTIDVPTIDTQAAADAVLRLVQTFKALETVGNALREISSLTYHKAELEFDVARLKAEKASVAGAVLLAESDAKAKLAGFNAQTDAATAALASAKATHEQFLIDSGKERSRQIAEQKRLDAALAETRDRMKQLAATAG